jgi:hypothetical protein
VDVNVAVVVVAVVVVAAGAEGVVEVGLGHNLVMVTNGEVGYNIWYYYHGNSSDC